MSTTATLKVVTVDCAVIETDLIAAAQIERLASERDSALKLRDALQEKLAISDAKILENAEKITQLEAENKNKVSTIKLGDKELSIEDALKLFSDMNSEIDALKNKTDQKVIDGMVNERLKTLEAGKRIAKDVVSDGISSENYRREVLKVASASNPALKNIVDNVLGDTGLDKSNDELIRAAFNAITAAQIASNDKRHSTPLGDEILRASSGSGQAGGQVSMRQKAEDTITGAWKTQKIA